MVLRVRVRSGRLHLDHTSFSRMSSYVVLIGGGNRFRTVTDKNGGKQPVWEESLTFPNNPPNVKLEIWVEHPNGDILAGEVLLDMCDFYQREPYRIEPKSIALGLKKELGADIKIQMDFDYDGMSQEQLKKAQGNGNRPPVPPKTGNLQVGTVIAQGRRKNEQMARQQANIYNQSPSRPQNQSPYRKPQTANDNYNNYNNYNNPQPNQKPQTATNKNNNKKPYSDKDKDFYTTPDAWTTNKQTWNNPNKNDGWGNNIDPPNKMKEALEILPGNNNGGNNNPNSDPWTNNNNWGLNKQNNNGWDDWTPSPISNNDPVPKNIPKGILNNKKDPWAIAADPYGNNNGWDL